VTLTLLRAFALALIVLPAAAGAQSGVATVKTEIAGKSIELFVPSGHCLLDRKQPSDINAIQLVERLTAGQNQLHLFAADCTQLSEWRAGGRPTLGEYAQVQSALQFHNQDLTGRETEVIKSICTATREQGNQITAGVETDIKNKIEAGKEKIKIENVAMLGALGEDDMGCYVGLIIKGVTDAGVPKSQLCVFANVVLNGRIMYIYRYAETVDQPTADRLLLAVKASARTHVLANNGKK
jgi:hypothetical protein